ncbi:hypothetical protein I4F81_009425 [Pyropia yezoensis]|uniref:Uncharacterized protein n=1 Tax=Pyropia yezoensis TaxID=2788 RepID=A0ACC3CAV4_PYRYE|nr:hypothetical protein I4F81_009425 [Neopyropia yezoensis]
MSPLPLATLSSPQGRTVSTEPPPPLRDVNSVIIPRGGPGVEEAGPALPPPPPAPPPPRGFHGSSLLLRNGTQAKRGAAAGVVRGERGGVGGVAPPGGVSPILSTYKRAVCADHVTSTGSRRLATHAGQADGRYQALGARGESPRGRL